MLFFQFAHALTLVMDIHLFYYVHLSGSSYYLIVPSLPNKMNNFFFNHHLTLFLSSCMRFTFVCTFKPLFDFHNIQLFSLENMFNNIKNIMNGVQWYPNLLNHRFWVIVWVFFIAFMFFSYWYFCTKKKIWPYMKVIERYIKNVGSNE